METVSEIKIDIFPQGDFGKGEIRITFTSNAKNVYWFEECFDECYSYYDDILQKICIDRNEEILYGLLIIDFHSILRLRGVLNEIIESANIEYDKISTLKIDVSLTLKSLPQ